MTQQRVWKDPTRPQFPDLPEELRRHLLLRLAKMALQYLQGRSWEKKRDDHE